ncbi:MAG: hypothetical protein ACLRMW_06955 [[Clostridium] symbiosum]
MIDDEEDDKAADSSKCQYSGDAHDNRSCIFSFADLDDGPCNGFGGACELVDSSEQRADEEYQKIFDNVVSGSRHKLVLQAG